MSLVDFVENSLGCSAQEALRLVQSDPTTLLKRQEAVASLLNETWVGTPLNDQRLAERPGELWPVLPRNAPDIVALATAPRGDEIGVSGESLVTAPKVEAQGLLLYAHGLHMPNPFRNHHASNPYRRPRRSSVQGADFLQAIAKTCALAPLISNDVVRVFEPAPPPSLADLYKQDPELADLPGHIGIALRYYENNREFDQGWLREAADVLILRAMETLADLAAGGYDHRGSVYFPTPYDAAAIRILLSLGQHPERQHMDASVSEDTLLLHQLIHLQLPGLRTLQLSDVVAVRDDDSFGIFRSDVAAALTAARVDVQSGDVRAARRIVSEHMDAGLARLNTSTRRGVLSEAIIGEVIGWGMGAAVAASIAGLQAAVAVLLGKVASDVVRSWPSSGQRALRRHYVQLGTRSINASSMEPIDFSQDIKTFLPGV